MEEDNFTFGPVFKLYFLSTAIENKACPPLAGNYARVSAGALKKNSSRELKE